MFLNAYKWLYKFGLGDTNVWMLDRYICQPNIRLSEAYLWICLEMFIVARDKIDIAVLPDNWKIWSNSAQIIQILYVLLDI